MSKLLDILLQRNDPAVPWGFSIHGGFDRGVAPFISTVIFGTVGAQYLNAGDRVLQIQRQPAGGLLQSELEGLVQEDGRDLRLLVEKADCPRRFASVPPVPNGYHSGGESETPLIVSKMVMDKARKEMRARQKRFLRMSEQFIEDHFRRMRDFLDDSWYVRLGSGVARKQQHQPSAGPGAGGDEGQASAAAPPPPPPPPPSLPTALPGRRLKTEIPERGLEPPPAIQNAMLTKDKKPFTYTPGGIDLSEIRSPKMQRRINRNACAEEMTGRPAPSTGQAMPTGPPPTTPYSAMQSQLPTSVLPARGVGAPPPPPPMPQSAPAGDGAPPPPPPLPPPSTAATAAAPPSQPKPPAFHKPPQMSFDPNEILVRANRNQSQEPTPKREVRPNSFNAEPVRSFRAEEDSQKTNANDLGQRVQKPQNEPGQIYVPPVAPKSPVEATPAQAAANHSVRAQLGSIYVPPVQEQSTATPTSPFGPKVQSPSPVASPMSPQSSAEVKQQAPWATAYRTPQATAPAWLSGRQPESPKPQSTRIIPIQIEGREPTKPQPQVQPQPQHQAQQYSVQNQQQQLQYNTQPQQQSRPHTRVIPIQIEGASQSVSPPQTAQGYQNKFNPMTPTSPTPYTPPSADRFNPMTPTSPTPYTPPSADREQKPQWAPVQPRPYTEASFGQQRVQSEPQQRIQPQPEYGTYNTAGVPLSQLRKMQLSEDDRALMDKFKSQVEKHGNDAITDENANPRYRGGHIPSRVFKMLDESVDDENYLHRESDPRYRGAAIPSRAFRLLQNMTDTAGDIPQQVPKGPMRVPVNRSVPSTPEPPPGPYIPASDQQVQEPRKYTGGSIPSRSFRMLQAMTGQEISAQSHAKANSSSGRSTPVPGMGRWCPSPVPPPVDPYWYLYHSDPFLMYSYMSDMNAAYGYFPPQPYPACRYTPTPFHCLSDNDEQGYSSTDELGQYYANYRNRMAYSPFVRNADPYYQNGGVDEYTASRSSTPSILITPAPGSKVCKGRKVDVPLKQSIEKKEYIGAQVMGEVKACEEEKESESSSEEDTETDTDGEEEEENDISREIAQSAHRMRKSGTLQTLKSVSDVGIYASESSATVTNEEDWEEKNKDNVGECEEVEDEEEEVEMEVEEEEESSCESLQEESQENLPHQLSVIYEESEHSDAESMRQKESSRNSTTKSITSESEVSNLENGEEESEDDDALDTESSVTVRLPLRLRFTRGENDEDVTTVIVGDSEVRKSVETGEAAQKENVEVEEKVEKEEGEEEEDEADVSVTFSLPSRSNSVISVEKKVEEAPAKVDESEVRKPEKWDKPAERKEPEADAEVTVSLSLRKTKSPEGEKRSGGDERRNLDRLSYDSKTEESDSTHCEDDSSSTSVDTVVKHREDTDEEETERPEEVSSKMEDFTSWLNSNNDKDWNEKTGGDLGLEGKATEKGREEEEEDDSYEAGVGRLEQMISSMLEKTKGSLEEGAERGRVKKENSQEESEDDSGVTSDMSAKHLASETDVDTESDYSELSKMTQCQRASTHSRLFKLLQEECGGGEEGGTDPEEKPKKEGKLSAFSSASSESLSARKERLTLPLNTSSEAESLSSSSGVTSPSSPTVSERLVKELVHSLLNKKKGKKFRKLPLAKLHAAALRILQEDMDPYDTSSNSASGDDGFLLSPIHKTTHSPKATNGAELPPEPEVSPDMIYGANYYDYLDYYSTWGNAAAYYPEAEHEIVPSKAFRMLSLQPNAMDGLKAKCPRIPSGGAGEGGSGRASGRQTPSGSPRREADDLCQMSFADKRDKVAKVLENSGKC